MAIGVMFKLIVLGRLVLRQCKYLVITDNQNLFAFKKKHEQKQEIILV